MSKIFVDKLKLRFRTTSKTNILREEDHSKDLVFAHSNLDQKVDDLNAYDKFKLKVIRHHAMYVWSKSCKSLNSTSVADVAFAKRFSKSTRLVSIISTRVSSIWVVLIVWRRYVLEFAVALKSCLLTSAHQWFACDFVQCSMCRRLIIYIFSRSWDVVVDIVRRVLNNVYKRTRLSKLRRDERRNAQEVLVSKWSIVYVINRLTYRDRLVRVEDETQIWDEKIQSESEKNESIKTWDVKELIDDQMNLMTLHSTITIAALNSLIAHDWERSKFMILSLFILYANRTVNVKFYKNINDQQKRALDDHARHSLMTFSKIVAKQSLMKCCLHRWLRWSTRSKTMSWKKTLTWMIHVKSMRNRDRI